MTVRAGSIALSIYGLLLSAIGWAGSPVALLAGSMMLGSVLIASAIIARQSESPQT